MVGSPGARHAGPSGASGRRETAARNGQVSWQNAVLEPTDGHNARLPDSYDRSSRAFSLTLKGTTENTRA